MDKPVTVVREELKQKIVNAVNEANLPAFVVSSILKDFLLECQQLEKQQYEHDKKNYEASLTVTEEEVK